MRRFMLCVSLAAVTVAGCGQSGGGGSDQSVEVNAKQVSPEALRAAVSDERVRRFYEARAWAPVWSDKLAQELTAAFADSERHAIDSKAFLDEARKDGSPAEREAGLTLAALNYAQALATGAVDPRKVFEVYTVPMHQADVVAGLAQATGQGGVRAWLASLAPSDPEYKALSDAYLAYRRRAAAEQRQAIQPGKKIEVGDRDPRVPLIAAALRSNGYLPPEQPQPQPQQTQAKGKAQAKAAPASDRYSAEIAKAVSRVQADYGIEADGVIGNSTLEALNTGAKDRARILAVNLERRRWLERNQPGTRIDVNTAGAFLEYWRDGQRVDTRRVVVGQTEWETPELGSPMVRLVANPPWTVPESIAEEEILPKGAAYMAREHITTKNGRLVQEPGPKSALGLVKFDLINPHQIYLHDTPAKALFASTERHASHGCARVENAIEFARLIASHDGVLEAFDKALATGKETPVPLKAKIPVRLLYHSAFWDGSRVVFRTDPYAWDDKLAAALGLGGAVRQRVQTHVHDIGP
ncbi:MAG TPA: L,D-transpeptidase family protein [Allosphingosinicella sp.]|jgi:murein L,D-transpeptidase YcbB/YkuD